MKQYTVEQWRALFDRINTIDSANAVAYSNVLYYADQIQDIVAVQGESLSRTVAVFIASQLQQDSSASEPLPVDVNRYTPETPCEYRLLNVKTGKFIGPGGDGFKPHFVDSWQDAMCFSSVNHHEATVEQTLMFQWEWMRDECDEHWMHDADVNDYRVHVVVG